MPSGLPKRANVGVPGQPVNIDPATYFIAKRMENVGMLRPGQAMILAHVLPAKAKRTSTNGKKGRTK